MKAVSLQCPKMDSVVMNDSEYHRANYSLVVP
jgi:hypothetical protein